MLWAATAKQRAEWARTLGLARMLGGLLVGVDPEKFVPPHVRAPEPPPMTAEQKRQSGKEAVAGMMEFFKMQRQRGG